MRCNLEDAIGRGVDDGASGAQMLFAELLDNRRPGGDRVAEHFATDGPLKTCHQVGWKSVGVGGQRACEDNTGHFPVPVGGVPRIGVMLPRPNRPSSGSSSPPTAVAQSSSELAPASP